MRSGVSLTKDAPARAAFKYSILYLFVLFAALAVDRLAGVTCGMALDPDDMRRRRARNWAMLVVLLALCVLFYAITIVKMTKS